MAKQTRKLTGPEYQTVKQMAETVSGYTSDSRIWGKSVPDILQYVSEQLDSSKSELNSGYTSTALEYILNAQEYLDEFRKRIAKQTIINAAVHNKSR